MGPAAPHPPLTVLVLASPGDPGLLPLDPPPAGVRFVAGDRPELLAAAAADAGAIFSMGGGRALLEPVFRMAPRVRWVHSRPAGVDHLLFPALVESGVTLTNSRGLFSAALAEFVLAALLFFAKDLRRMVASQSAGRWDPFDTELLHGRTLGLVGYGDIGRAVAERARALGMEVLALRRRPGETPGERVLGPAGLAELLAGSDGVVVTTPLTPATRGLLGAAELARMKRTAVLVNVGRGAVADEAALLACLRGRRIRGAALDVFETEPLPAGHPFYALDNVLLSPHCADRAGPWREEATRIFLRNLERFARGEPLLNVVDLALGY